MSKNRNSHPSNPPPNHPPEPGSGSSFPPTSLHGSQGTYSAVAGKNATTKWQLVHKIVHDAGGESIYATHYPPVTNPYPNTITYTGLPRTASPSDFHNVCWDTVAPLSGYRSRAEDNGTKSFFIGYDLNKTDFQTRAEFDQYALKTPVNFAGNQYLPQIPIPENVNITKIYVSEVSLPTEKCDVDLFISNGLVSYFSEFATVLKITLPKVVSGQYIRYHLDAHVFLAPLKGQQEIAFPAISKDNMYEVPLWGRKIRTNWGSDAPCTYCKEPGHLRRACPELQKKICHNCKKPGHTALMCRKPMMDQGMDKGGDKGDPISSSSSSTPASSSPPYSSFSATTSSSSLSSLIDNNAPANEAKKRKNKKNNDKKKMKKFMSGSSSLEGNEMGDQEEGSSTDNDTDMENREGELSDQYDLSSREGSQEGDDIFVVPPGQSTQVIPEVEMKDATDGGAPDSSLGQGGSKPGGKPIGGPDAAHGGSRNNTNATGGPRTSGRDRKEPVRFNPDKPTTY